MGIGEVGESHTENRVLQDVMGPQEGALVLDDYLRDTGAEDETGSYYQSGYPGVDRLHEDIKYSSGGDYTSSLSRWHWDKKGEGGASIAAEPFSDPRLIGIAFLFGPVVAHAFEESSGWTRDWSSLEREFGSLTTSVAGTGKSKHILVYDAAGNVVGHFKPAKSVGDQYLSEVFAYRFAKRLGLDNVPETFVVDHPVLGLGSFQRHVDAEPLRMPWFSFLGFPGGVSKTERQKALILDVLLGHRDRYEDNVLVKDGRLFLVDNQDTDISTNPIPEVFSPDYENELKGPMTDEARDFFNAIDIDQTLKDMERWLASLPKDRRAIPSYKLDKIKQRYERIKNTWAAGKKTKYENLIHS